MNMKTKKAELKFVDTPLPKWYEGSIYSAGDLVENPYTGDQAILTANELAMYDLIKGAERFHQYELVRKGLDWFRSANPRAYMILLD